MKFLLTLLIRLIILGFNLRRLKGQCRNIVLKGNNKHLKYVKQLNTIKVIFLSRLSALNILTQRRMAPCRIFKLTNKAYLTHSPS